VCIATPQSTFVVASAAHYNQSLLARDLIRGGDPVLVSAGGAVNFLWGDAREKTSGVITGRDTFVLEPSHGGEIGDFEPGQDTIDLTAFAERGARARGWPDRASRRRNIKMLGCSLCCHRMGALSRVASAVCTPCKIRLRALPYPFTSPRTRTTALKLHAFFAFNRMLSKSRV
jgi:hypothetical protein